MIDRKQDLVHALEVMQKKEHAAKNPFKARAYAKVVKQIKALNSPVYSMDDLKDIEGIGASIKDKIREILDTGKLHQAEEYMNKPEQKLVEQLLSIHSIGPAKAKELVEKHGIKTIEELKEKQDTLLNDKQKMGLKYFGEFDLRIPRAEMDKHNVYIKEVFASIDKKYVVELAGSYRREEKDSGDIDVLITHPDDDVDHEGNLTKIIDRFVKDKYITDIFAKGPKKCLAVCKAKRYKHFRRIDFMMTAKHEFPFALLYFTGSGPFNVEMRNYALEKGYSLSEYGLKCMRGDRQGDFVSVNFTKEEEVFAFLGLKYVLPRDRKANVLSMYKM